MSEKKFTLSAITDITSRYPSPWTTREVPGIKGHKNTIVVDAKGRMVIAQEWADPSVPQFIVQACNNMFAWG